MKSMKKTKKIYPAIFHREENGYWVEFPDLDGCFTQGDELEKAVSMSEEALGLYLVALEEDKQPFPEPSNPSNIKVKKGDFISLISINVSRYRRIKSTAISDKLSLGEERSYHD